MADNDTELTADERLVQDAIDSLLAAHPPKGMPPREFRGYQYDAGLAWVTFPKGFGGLGVAPKLQIMINRQLNAAGGPNPEPTSFFGLSLAGPTIATHGTDEQRTRLLRPMFTGEEAWCQLFSEPGAGSDLASLACKAVKDGEEWLVNGQKVWNTMAHLADKGMLVTRTDPEQVKHRGMTYFAVDMHAPGVEVRPLRQITGEAEFNEVYLTDVRIPDGDRIGDVGQGWAVSMTTLMNERTTIGGGGSGQVRPAGSGPIAEAVRLYKAKVERTGHVDVVQKDALMHLWIKAEVLRLTNIRAGQNRRVGNPGPEGSIAKVAHAEVNQQIYAMCVDILGMDGQVGFDYDMKRSDAIGLEGPPGSSRKMFLRARANSIEGGTSQIQRNILGERVLGLPGDVRVDKALPWSQVPR